MPLFMYRCPKTGYRVQGFSAEDISEDHHIYEPVTCLACRQVHHVGQLTFEPNAYRESMGEHPPLPVCQALNDQRHLSLSVDLRLTFSGAKADIDQITVNARDFMSARPSYVSKNLKRSRCKKRKKIKPQRRSGGDRQETGVPPSSAHVAFYLAN